MKRETSRNTLLTLHLNKPRPKFSCNECNKDFYDRHKLKMHTSVHLGLSYPCEKCGYQAKLLSNLNQHTKNHHEEKKWYLCHSCDYKGSKKGLRVHTESIHGSKLFKCDKCEYVSRIDVYLKRHVKGQHGTDMFNCVLCDYSCHSKSQLQHHIKSVHSNTSYQCTKCDRVTKSKDSLSHHMRTHEIRRLKCDSCEKTYKTRTELRIHMLNKHEGVIWQCTICPYKAASPSILREHMKHFHRINLIKKHKCLECGQMFGKRFNLTMHLRIHTGEKCEFCDKKLRRGFSKFHRLGRCNKVQKEEDLKIKCEHCNFLSDNQSVLKLHALSHQISLVDIMKNLPPSIKEASFKTEDEFQEDLKIFLEHSSVRNSESEPLRSNHKEFTIECTECGKKLSSHGSLKKHTKMVHEPEFRIECEKCGKKFHTDSIRRHMRNVHKENTNESLSDCKNCGKKLQTESLPRHMINVHNGEKSNKCNQCDFASSRADNLMTHLKTHSGEKSEKCNQCEYASSRVDHLRKHLKTHREKSNKCNQCNYASFQAGNLVTHLKTHSREKSNKCNQCDYACIQASDLRKHLITHSGEKSNKCNQCEYASSRAGSLRRHLKIHCGGKVKQIVKIQPLS